MENETERIPEAEPTMTDPAAEAVMPEAAPEAPVEAQPLPGAAPEQAEAAPAPAFVTACDVQVRGGSRLAFFDPGELKLKAGDHLILDTARGLDYGLCIVGNHRIPAREGEEPLQRVVRIATENDERIKAENDRKEKAAFAFCMKKIEELGLDMQLASAECAFDGSKLLFFFTADERVDFRELVRILASNYHTRIELRQIGVRDKAKMFGGLGICGRPFCCSSFLSDFEPVSIKMAKTQNLSLNPTKISGTCGRLMCCLKYEQDAYEDLIKSSPKVESFVDTPDGRGTVASANLMRQTVSVRMEKDPEEVRTFQNSEVLVLRSGKAKKTSPPIPDDLAPISGRKEEDPVRRISRVEQRLVLDAEEAEADVPVPEPEAPQPAGAGRERHGGGTERPRQERNRPEGDRRQEGRRRGPAEQNPAPAKPGEAPAAQPERQQRNSQGRNRRPDRRGGQKSGQKPAENKKPQKEEKKFPEMPKTLPGEQKPGKEPKPGWDKPAPGAEPQKKSGNRRRYYHHRKPKQGS